MQARSCLPAAASGAQRCLLPTEQTSKLVQGSCSGKTLQNRVGSDTLPDSDVSHIPYQSGHKVRALQGCIPHALWRGRSQKSPWACSQHWYPWTGIFNSSALLRFQWQSGNDRSPMVLLTNKMEPAQCFYVSWPDHQLCLMEVPMSSPLEGMADE